MNAFADIQHARLVTLACPGQPALAAALAVARFTGRESINELFRFDVDVLAASPDLDIDALIGQAFCLGLLQPDGTRRAWHGLCTQAGAAGADGGWARYTLRIEPAVAQLQHRRDSHIFQDLDARGMVSALLADYPAVQCRFDLTRALAIRPICTQYRETDFAFLRRLLASEGLNWRFDHAVDGHRLVIYDPGAPLPPLPGGATLRFHGMRATDVDDAIDTWHARRAVQPNAVALSSWDPAQLLAPAAEQPSRLDAGDLPALAIYDGSGECSASADPDGHGRLMLQALEQHNKLFIGAGAVRRLAPGHGFTLSGHDHYPAGESGFTVLWVEHAARNNLATGIRGAGDADLADAIYRNTFACVRDTVALAPRAIAAPHPCTASGTQSALVVGMPNAVATTTRDHQVRIQFSWQRGHKPNPGGLPHRSAGGGNAPGDATCGTWVRVAEALAGPNWGSQFTPRIGTEVLVAFIEGDIDRPVIIGQLHNGVTPPPFPAGAGAQADHDGVLAGIQTGNFDGSGYNQWQLDDTADGLRMRLATSTAAAELHLGQLVEQPVGTAARGAARGSGFALHTSAWTVLRGAEGVLLSTSARPALGSGITSTQLDAREAVALYRGAQSLSSALVQAAVQQQALASADACKAQVALADGIDPAQKGKYPGPVNGQPAAKAEPGAREPDPAQPVERFAVPAVLLDAAAAMNWATPASTAICAGRHVHWTTQSDLHLAAGATCATVAGAAASLFTHAGGIQAIAANGPVSLQAHTDQLEVVADKEVVVVSVGAAIAIEARSKIVLQAGQASITLDGGDITFACPGNFTAKGGQHVFDGGASGTTALARLPAQLVPLPEAPQSQS